MAAPQSPQDWLDVARERASDADAMVSQRSRSWGPVYMAGWAIECALNGFLAVRGISRPRPAGGETQHDLMRLWKAARFEMRDLAGDGDGQAQAWMLENWGTHLRYDKSGPFFDSAPKVRAARRLFAWLSKHSRRNTKGRPR